MADNETNYINMLGNIKHCWQVHVKKMKRENLPRVTYSTFRHRIREYKRTLYKAINTPADVRHRDKDRRKKVKFFKIQMFFRRLFNLGWSEKK